VLVYFSLSYARISNLHFPSSVNHNVLVHNDSFIAMGVHFWWWILLWSSLVEGYSMWRCTLLPDLTSRSRFATATFPMVSVESYIVRWLLS